MSRQASDSGTVSVRLLAPAARYLAELAIDVSGILREAGLPPDLLSDADSRLDGLALIRVMELARERSGDAAFGVHAGERLRAGDIGVLEYLIRTSDSAGEVRDQLDQYHRLLGDFPPEVVTDNGRVVCRLVSRDSQLLPPLLVEYNLAIWTQLARILGEHDRRPDEVLFRHPRPDYASEVERVFDTSIFYDRNENAVVFGSDSRAMPIFPSDEGIRRAIGAEAGDALRAIRTDVSIADRVRGEVRRALLQGGTSASEVAQMLGLAERTLRRQLQAANTTFKAIHDGARCDHAKEQLRRSNQSISEIAFELGFADSAAFHRAFKRWTGETPAGYREEQK